MDVEQVAALILKTLSGTGQSQALQILEVSSPALGGNPRVSASSTGDHESQPNRML
jgi:hypothetical protein